MALIQSWKLIYVDVLPASPLNEPKMSRKDTKAALKTVLDASSENRIDKDLYDKNWFM